MEEDIDKLPVEIESVEPTTETEAHDESHDEAHVEPKPRVARKKTEVEELIEERKRLKRRLKQANQQLEDAKMTVYSQKLELDYIKDKSEYKLGDLKPKVNDGFDECVLRDWNGKIMSIAYAGKALGPKELEEFIMDVRDHIQALNKAGMIPVEKKAGGANRDAYRIHQ